LSYPHHGGPDDRRQRFEEVYAANRGPILGYVLRRTGSPHDAADVLAETFLTAWRRLDDVPPGDQARLWLYGVARRVLANQQRGEHRRSELAGRLRAELTTAYQAPEYAGELAGIAAAFRSLPEADRELLALVGWKDWITARRRPCSAAPATPCASGCTGRAAGSPAPSRGSRPCRRRLAPRSPLAPRRLPARHSTPAPGSPPALRGPASASRPASAHVTNGGHA